jgi:UDP-N-acetylmuramate--alanine ligase
MAHVEPTRMFHKIHRIHMVGIGGAGMSGIAEVLNAMSYQVAGSDLRLSATTERLTSLGMRVMEGHDAANVGDAQVVVYSSAVKPGNPELVAASRRNIPVIERSEMLGELTRLAFCIGVAGTHGKTTTTSMIGHILTRSGMAPTIIVGGTAKNLGSGGVLGGGRYMVVEADEYARTFLKMFPCVGVVTTLEVDHLDCYENLDDLRSAFAEYLSRLPFYGMAFMGIDDQNVRGLIHNLSRPFVTYGFAVDADFRAVDVERDGFAMRFGVERGGERLGTIDLRIPGEHNVQNALAAVAVCLELDVPFTDIADALAGFMGVDRRFQIRGEVDGVTVVDDYAHHPTELAATLRAARNGWSKGRVLCVFQPHLYSRTREFQREFAEALGMCDLAVVMDIFAAREAPIEGVSSDMIADWCGELGNVETRRVVSFADAAQVLRDEMKPGDLVLTVGAGDVWKVGSMLLGEQV